MRYNPLPDSHSMFDFQFFKPIIQFVLIVGLLIFEVLAVFRLAIRITQIENPGLRTLLLFSLVPLCLVLVYVDFVFVYIVGGGH